MPVHDAAGTLAWFSAGAASAVATKLALGMYDDVTIYRTDVGSEHPDDQPSDPTRRSED